MDDDWTAKRLGGRVRAMREAANWTKAELARRAHISASFVRQIEQGEVQPRFEFLVKVVAAFDVTLSAFFSSPPPTINGERKKDLPS